MKIMYKLKESLDQAHELSSLIQQSQNKEILFYLTDSSPYHLCTRVFHATWHHITMK